MSLDYQAREGSWTIEEIRELVKSGEAGGGLYFQAPDQFTFLTPPTSKVEDVNTSSMPITLLFIVGFYIVFFSISGGGRLDSALMKIASFLPITSPMAMFARVSMTEVPFWQIGLSLVILAVSVIGVGILAARIYRVGVLLYGQPPKIGEILKMMRRRNS